MKIKCFYIGNRYESYIEDKLSSDFNIIHSSDNNRGKTIVIQGILYALGNVPVFPSTFNYKDYYYVIDIEENSRVYSICRKKDSMIVKTDIGINVFDSISEYKYYFNKNITALPVILKDGKEKLVDIELFCQIFFLGQDKKNTSDIFNAGYYKKADFYNMLYNIFGVNQSLGGDMDITDLNEELKHLKIEKSSIIKQNKVLASINKAYITALSTNSGEQYKNTIMKVDKTKDEIVNLKNRRSRITNRKIRNEITLKELNSVNNTLSTGKLKCLDCQSYNIGYETENKEFSFDITNADIRSQIIESIEQKIAAYAEEIEKLSSSIVNKQNELRELLKADDATIENLIIYKDDILKSDDGDKKISLIDKRIAEIKNIIKINTTTKVSNSIKQKLLINSITAEMYAFYREMDPYGNLEFNDLFSKRDQTFSGSEETEFYLAKLYAFAKVFDHNFPIIIDSFREGELSTNKEEIVINKFKTLKNQKIFSATPKNEEIGKYANKTGITDIDYSNYLPSKILTSARNDEFIAKITSFNINL